MFEHFKVMASLSSALIERMFAAICALRKITCWPFLVRNEFFGEENAPSVKKSVVLKN
jgi:hypothetical protein